MEIELAIDKEVMNQMMDVLVTAEAVAVAGRPLPTKNELRAIFQKHWTALLKIGSRYLSDSPSPDEKRKFGIAVFEEALRIAKGEK